MAVFMRHASRTNQLFSHCKTIKIWHHLAGLQTCQSMNSYSTVTTVLRTSRCSHVLHRFPKKVLRQTYIVCSVGPTRSNSTGSGSQPPSLPEGYIPEPPPIPIPDIPTLEAAESAQQTLNALGEPTLASLGLAHWTPTGLFQTALESLHVGLDIPWWGAIVISTICIRLAMFPLVILSQRNSANMSNHMPTVQRLQEKFTTARLSGNPLDAAKAADELMSYMKRNNVKPGRNMLVPLAQMPVFISVFVGLRQMANLPVESMVTGGLLWLPNLTIPDPFYALPLLTMTTLLITIEMGVDGVSAGNMAKMKWVMRAMPVFFFPFIINFPAAMCVYWFTSNVFSLMQVSFLKIPGISEYFSIPKRVKHDDSMISKKKPFKKGFRETWDNSRLMAQIEDRQRMDAVKFREAGTGPLQKTYSYDPTKVKQQQKAKAKSR